MKGTCQLGSNTISRMEKACSSLSLLQTKTVNLPLVYHLHHALGIRISMRVPQEAL